MVTQALRFRVAASLTLNICIFYLHNEVCILYAKYIWVLFLLFLLIYLTYVTYAIRWTRTRTRRARERDEKENTTMDDDDRPERQNACSQIRPFDHQSNSIRTFSPDHQVKKNLTATIRNLSPRLLILTDQARHEACLVGGGEEVELVDGIVEEDVSSRQSLATGRMYSPLAVRTRAFLTILSVLGSGRTMHPIGHDPRAVLGSAIRTTSPSCKFIRSFSYLRRSVRLGTYSFIHLLQKRDASS